MSLILLQVFSPQPRQFTHRTAEQLPVQKSSIMSKGKKKSFLMKLRKLPVKVLLINCFFCMSLSDSS